MDESQDDSFWPISRSLTFRVTSIKKKKKKRKQTLYRYFFSLLCTQYDKQIYGGKAVLSKCTPRNGITWDRRVGLHRACRKYEALLGLHVALRHRCLCICTSDNLTTPGIPALYPLPRDYQPSRARMQSKLLLSIIHVTTTTTSCFINRSAYITRGNIVGKICCTDVT